jgi:hypothetical protein
MAHTPYTTQQLSDMLNKVVSATIPGSKVDVYESPHSLEWKVVAWKGQIYASGLLSKQQLNQSNYLNLLATFTDNLINTLKYEAEKLGFTTISAPNKAGTYGEITLDQYAPGGEYSLGSSPNWSKAWANPVPPIKEALNDGFYTASKFYTKDYSMFITEHNVANLVDGFTGQGSAPPQGGTPFPEHDMKAAAKPKPLESMSDFYAQMGLKLE